MIITIGEYRLEDNIECKCIPDGWEIFPHVVDTMRIKPEHFAEAYWQGGSIIVLR